MIEMETSQFPKHVATALMLRGAQLPPLQWHVSPCRPAKTVLDETANDVELLGVEELVDEGMAAAVRAMLYLYNGWPSETAMYACLAPDAEQAFVEAIQKRQLGDTDASKSLFQKIDEHPIYAELAEYAKNAIGMSTTPLLKRLRKMIEFAGQWEPFAFSDVYVESCAGKHDPAGEQVVRSIQCREFELLFAHCYEGATGRKPVMRKPKARPRPRPRVPVPPRRPPMRPLPTAAPSSGAAPAAPTPAPVPPADTVEVLCPHCHDRNFFPQDKRGAPAKCRKCRGAFLVPKQRSASASS